VRIALVLVATLAVGASAAFVAAHRVTSQPEAAAAVAPSAPATRHVPRRTYAPPKPQRLYVGPPKISIPRLHLRSRVYPLAELDRGPAWWRITGRPGGGDTVAIAGHRTTHTHPFYYLDRVRPGDLVYVTYRGHAYRYRVRDSRVVPSSDLHIADAVGYERLLLTACTPRGSAAFRLVVEARRA
jgi:sortase A